jgi:hypothetical protein
VEAVFRLQADVVELHLGGQTITTTMEHPFYREGEGWVRVMDLQSGDRLVGRDGQATRLDTITRTEERVTVYNLRVATDHTYFVGDADWGFSLWVHNAYLVQSVADGTFQIVDDVGNVVRKGIPDQATASALATQLNTPAVKQLDDLAGAVPNQGKIAAPNSVPKPTVLQTGGHTLTDRVRNSLGLTKDEAKRALEGLKRDLGQGNAHHQHKTLDNGDVLDSHSGELLGNLFDYL